MVAGRFVRGCIGTIFLPTRPPAQMAACGGGSVAAAVPWRGFHRLAARCGLARPASVGGATASTACRCSRSTSSTCSRRCRLRCFHGAPEWRWRTPHCEGTWALGGSAFGSGCFSWLRSKVALMQLPSPTLGWNMADAGWVLDGWPAPVGHQSRDDEHASGCGFAWRVCARYEACDGVRHALRRARPAERNRLDGVSAALCDRCAVKCVRCVESTRVRLSI